MSARELAELLMPVVVAAVLGLLFRRSEDQRRREDERREEQRRDTGRRVGALEKYVDFERGRRAGQREGAKRKDHG